MLNNNLVKKFLPEKTRNSTRSKNRFLFIFSCLAFIFCSTIRIQSSEYVINEPVILKGETFPDLKNIDRSAIIDNGDTVVFDFSQAVLSNGFLDLPVSIISDDIDVFSLDFQFRFNTTDFTYNTVINSYGLEALQGNFNVADQILRVFSFDLNVLPNNTEMMKVRFSTTSSNICSLDLFNIIPLLNGEQCSYKIIGCGNLPAYAGVDQTICDDFTQLAANHIVSGIPSWSVISGSGVFSNVNDSTTLVSGLSPGENIFRWTFPATSNTPETFDEVSIFRDLPPSIANAGLDYQVCGNNTNLPGEIPLIGSGVWTLLSGNGTLDDSTDANSLFTFSIPGTYTLIWKVTNGSCPEESIDTLTIQKIEVANAGTDTLFCGNEIALNAAASASFSGFWTVNSGSAILSDSSSPNTLATNLSQGINLFTWTLSGTGCPDSTSQVQVTALEQPSVSSAGGDQIVCGNSAVLAAFSPAVGNGLWTATNSAITIQDPSNPVSAVSNLTFGIDTLIWTVTNGICTSVDSVIITSNILPVAIAGEDQTNCGNSTTLSANTPTDGTGIWTSLNTSIVFAEPTNPLSTVSNLTFGVDTLVWTITSGTCISIDSVFITSNVLPVATAGDDQSICESSTILAATNPPNVTGIWTSLNASVFIAEPTNPSSAVSNLSGLDTLVWTVSDGDCISVDSVFITSNTLTIANAGEDQINCGNSTTLSANTPTDGTGVWTSLNASIVFAEPTNPLSTVSNLTFGVDTLVWTITSGTCISVDSVFITSNVLPVAIAGDDQSICESSTILAATNPPNGTGIWTSLNASVIIAEPTNPLSAVSNLSGLDTLVWTVSDGDCISIDSVFITSNTLTIAIAGDDQTNCGNSTTLSANTPTDGTGIWSSLNASVVFAEPTNPLSTVSNLTFGVDTLVWTITGGTCISVDSVFITSNVLPVAIAGDDQSICESSTILAASNPPNGTGIWTSLNASVFIAEPTNPLSAVSNLSGLDTLVWTVSDGACISVDSVFITSNNLTIANAGEDQINCGNSTTLAASNPTNGSGIWASLNASIVFAEASNPLSAISNLTFGVDTLIWIVTNGTCISVDSVFITSNVLPQVNVGLDTTICEFQQSITIPISASGYTSLSWEVLLGNGEVNDQTTLFPSFNNMSLDQNNIFGIIVQNGLCVVYDTLDIFVNSDESQFCNTRPIFIPEGFSPNGDGTYDLFQILNLNGLNADVKIFNRWGDQVFADANYQNDWNGTANQGLVLYGEELPAGTYFYIIQIEGEAEPRKDYLTLWR